MGVPPKISPSATYGNRVAWNDAVRREWLTDVREVVLKRVPQGVARSTL